MEFNSVLLHILCWGYGFRREPRPAAQGSFSWAQGRRYASFGISWAQTAPLCHWQSSPIPLSCIFSGLVLKDTKEREQQQCGAEPRCVGSATTEHSTPAPTKPGPAEGSPHLLQSLLSSHQVLPYPSSTSAFVLGREANL